MTASRRDLFALGGLAALGGVAPVQGAELDVSTYGLRVSLVYRPEGWAIVVLDYDSMDDGPYYTGWRPGFAPVFKYVPLADYLAQVEEICNIKKAAV